MKLDQFLIDFQPKGEKVLVEAEALQNVYKVIDNYEMVCKSQQKTILEYQNKVFALEAKVQIMELNNYITIDLRG